MQAQPRLSALAYSIIWKKGHMAIERVIDNASHDDDAEEQVIEVSLRPTSFQEYVGQERLKRNLKIAIDAL